MWQGSKGSATLYFRFPRIPQRPIAVLGGSTMLPESPSAQAVQQRPPCSLRQDGHTERAEHRKEREHGAQKCR